MLDSVYVAVVGDSNYMYIHVLDTDNVINFSKERKLDRYIHVGGWVGMKNLC